MSDPETEEATPAPAVKTKQAAAAGGIAVAALTAAVAFTVAGPLGVGVAAAAVAGTGYAVHRIKNPSKRPWWLGKPSRPGRSTSKTGTLTWPFTGNQQRRALTRSTSGRAGGRSSGPKLPTLTGSRARRSQTLTGTGAGKPGSTGRRPVRRSTNGAIGLMRNPVSKPLTPTRSPAKLSNSRVGSLSRSKPGMPTRKSPSSTRSPSRQRGSGGTSKRSGTPLRLTNSRSRHRPTGAGTTRGRSSTTARRLPTGRGRFNPWLGTRGGQTLGRRSTDTRKTRRAGRIGGPLGSPGRATGLRGRIRNRLTPDRNRNTAPNRTALKPRPYARRTTGQLLRTGLRIPMRQRGTFGTRRGWRPLTRPTTRQAARARRTLRLRSAVWARRGASWIGHAPHRWWDRTYDRLPKAPLPLTHYTEKAAPKAQSGPKHKTPTPDPAPTPDRPLATVTPIVQTLMPIKQNGEVIYVSSPNDLIREAFQQMAAFHPSSATEVEAWVADLAGTLTEVGQSFGVLADQMRNGMPFAAPFADSVQEIGVAIGASSGLAQNAHATMRAAHESDFQRIEDPRPDEGMWNPEANR